MAVGATIAEAEPQVDKIVESPQTAQARAYAYVNSAVCVTVAL